MSSDFILACSERILVDNCSEDISSEKKATDDFSCRLKICWAALKAILVAKAVFPIEGLPAKITKSDLCKPPNFSSKSVSPVGTPTIPWSLCIAKVAILIVSSKALLNLR